MRILDDEDVVLTLVLILYMLTSVTHALHSDQHACKYDFDAIPIFSANVCSCVLVRGARKVRGRQLFC